MAVDGLSIECSTGLIVAQMEGVVRGHHTYKLDIGMFVDGRKYRRRLMVVLSTIDNNKLHVCTYVVALSRDQCSIHCVNLFH